MALFFHDCYVAPREDSLQAGPVIASFGPVGIHKFRDEDTVIRKDSQIASI